MIMSQLRKKIRNSAWLIWQIGACTGFWLGGGESHARNAKNKDSREARKKFALPKINFLPP